MDTLIKKISEIEEAASSVMDSMNWCSGRDSGALCRYVFHRHYGGEGGKRVYRNETE